MKLIFERSIPGTGQEVLAPCDVPEVAMDTPGRQEALHLPELAEGELSRHYSQLEDQAFGVNRGFYPLGSCTMKYNPKLHEAVVALPGFANLHPLVPDTDAQGTLAALALAEHYLCEVTGMDRMTFQPAAGAQGEYTGLLLIKKYHEKRGDTARKKIIVPESAHGTNPASAVMTGFEVVSVGTNADGDVDLDDLKKVLGPDTAGLMLTNPSTLGFFERDVLEITDAVHQAGGLVYYDGANLNAVMGTVRPGDMGFDCVHLNLHKTFSTPHGGGGPGSGAVGCKDFLAAYLPAPVLAEKNGTYYWDNDRPDSVGRVKQFHGHTAVVLRALAYVLSLGGNGLKAASEQAVLNANYLRVLLKDSYPAAFDRVCMHEYVAGMAPLKAATGVRALDLAKGMLEAGIHPPTIYFPLNVPEALMFEPTETESKATIDAAAEIFRKLIDEAHKNPEALHAMPTNTPVKRVDDVAAARKPIVRYDFDAQADAE
ncbi:aminomethyl-transferring glycine dehydrogenase subunit GcvPB [Peptococcus simiae]|uniref:aminomethyl-transferring glycine dehydrogenase subunit GcvPB n=1 Tax=Peptococcus simiae TaxID=1643805 RepID=UPI00397EA734